MIPTPTCVGLDGGSHVRAKARSVLAWPTPTVHGNDNYKGASAKSGDGLMTVIKRREGLWPTPQCNGVKHGMGEDRTNHQVMLIHAIRDRENSAINGTTKSAVYPTPRVNSLCGGTGAWNAMQCNPNLTAEEKRGLTSTRGQLNPDWEEWLMCWPVGWTDIETPNIRLVWLDPSIDPANYGEIPRVTNRCDNRPARVKAIGNGQFPLSAVIAFDWGLLVLETVA